MLPVWLLLAPRDYLSTFLKIGVIAALAIGIYVVMPDLRMEAVTRFADGSGPVVAGTLFPFLFITIACGAVSGFHALISSGTTPKMIEREGHARFIGYGGMLMESFVAIMALVAASVLDPGIYFAMNAPAAVIGPTAEAAAKVISEWGWVITPDLITRPRRTSANTPSCIAQAALQPWRSASRRSWRRCSAARRRKRCGTTSQSCSKRSSSLPQWMPEPVPAGS